MFKNILAATDLVSVSDPVVTAAVKVAQKYQANLHVLHVLESAHVDNRFLVKHFKTGKEIVASEDYGKEVQKEIENVYAGILKLSENDAISVMPGLPWEEIIRCSRHMNAGMIVLGPHSRRATEKGVIRVAGKIGSTVEGVVMRLEKFCGNFLNGVPHAYNIWGGALPHQEIIKCAEKNKADLIVMGSHTKKTDGKWYTGSVVERTGFRSNCPVIVITDPDALLLMREINDIINPKEYIAPVFKAIFRQLQRGKALEPMVFYKKMLYFKYRWYRYLIKHWWELLY